jgi:hypothetical protein
MIDERVFTEPEALLEHENLVGTQRFKIAGAEHCQSESGVSRSRKGKGSAVIPQENREPLVGLSKSRRARPTSPCPMGLPGMYIVVGVERVKLKEESRGSCAVKEKETGPKKPFLLPS